LLLGSAENALAALDNSIPGVFISHIVCVASSKNRNIVRRRAEQLERGDVPQLSMFTMRDRMSPDETIDISSDYQMQAALRCLSRALNGDASKGEEEAEHCQSDYATAPIRGVLVYCDKGVNRSPTLVLATLLLGQGWARGAAGQFGEGGNSDVLDEIKQCEAIKSSWRPSMSLRQAYARVLQSREHIDPLPTYRRALEELELAERGWCSVVSGGPAQRKEKMIAPDLVRRPRKQVDLFALHFSELYQVLNSSRYKCKDSSSRYKCKDQGDPDSSNEGEEKIGTSSNEGEEKIGTSSNEGEEKIGTSSNEGEEKIGTSEEKICTSFQLADAERRAIHSSDDWEVGLGSEQLDVDGESAGDGDRGLDIEQLFAARRAAIERLLGEEETS
jgi:hypothetical protein